MCGIAGWFGPAPGGMAPANGLEQMLDAIRHRGPDGRGQVTDANAALGHVRLAIIDPETGQQPMSDDSGRIHLVFNGAIFNYRALREELSAAGFRFATQSDTEVILRLYEAQGVDSFNRLRGMFAFALWDGRQDRGYLVRDSLGIKPLFVTQSGDRLLFGSEAKALLAVDPALQTLDTAGLHLVLNFRYVPDERTLFAGIRQLEPGAVLSWAVDGVRRSRLEPAIASESGSVLEVLRESVQLHCISDVPVGVFLSGGIDSGLIAALAERPLDTFTLDVGDDPGEARNAARTAELLGLPNRSEEVVFDAETDLPQLVWHLEKPKINALQSSLVARIACRHVKVVLSGMGGDELFYGYNAYAILWKIQRLCRNPFSWPLRQVAPHAEGVVKRLGGELYSEPARALRMLRAYPDWATVYGWLRNVWDEPGMRRIVYGPRMLDQPLPDCFELLHDLWPPSDDPMEAVVRFEWRRKMVNDLLWQEDRVSMARGLEVRVPFVDSIVEQCVRRLDWESLIGDGGTKAGLRELANDVLPEEILRRPKSGFQVDAGRFYQEHLLALAARVLEPGYVRAKGLFDPGFIQRLQKLRPSKRHRWHYFMLYMIIMTHLWTEVFEGDSAA